MVSIVTKRLPSTVYPFIGIMCAAKILKSWFMLQFPTTVGVTVVHGRETAKTTRLSVMNTILGVCHEA